MNTDSVSPTPSQRLAELLLERPLGEYVAEKRASVPRWPWRLIAERLTMDTGGQVQLSHETLRQWYGAPDEAEAAAS